jgi:GT2 family glycosyltransferase
MRPPVDIVVPVHNSPEDVRLCLDAVAATMGSEDGLNVVDDGSAEETQRLCEAAAARPRTVLIRRAEGSGFARAVNAGLAETRAPVVVLLNSDTIVTEGWLDRLSACLQANPQIGLAGPLSNAGGWQSVPDYLTGGPPNNAIRHDPATLAAIAAWCAGFRARFPWPVVEQLNGFCLALKREVLDAVGPLDEEAFPKGYGEEIDLGFRAQDAGFLCAVAIDCFVYHAKSKSYTSEARERLIREGRAVNDRRHGAERVRGAVKGTQGNPILAAIRAEAREVFLKNGWLLDE